MARSSLLLELVRAGARGDYALFRKALEALVTEERAKQHHVLADRLAAHLHTEGTRGNGPVARPTRRDGTATNLYHEVTTERRLDDLVLPDSVAHAGRELVEEHRRSELLAAYNLQPRHRVLLTGPPGNGKTSFAEAIATELAVPLVSVRYESVIASYLGETAVRLSRLFDQVRTRRCVLFFDEFDVVGKERGDFHETGEIKRVVSSLLLQIDTLPSSVVAISATNHPELLDRAVWRRFQLRLALPSPTQALAREWFRRFEQRAELKLEISPSTLARRLLHLPDGDVRTIVRERLKQWRERVPATDRPAAPIGETDA